MTITLLILMVQELSLLCLSVGSHGYVCNFIEWLATQDSYEYSDQLTGLRLQT